MAKTKFITADITGDKALDHALKQFPIKFARKPIQKVLKEVHKNVTLRDAQRTIPVKSGLLKKSLGIRTAKKNNGRPLGKGRIGFAVVSRTLKRLDVSGYASFVLLGTRHRTGTKTLRNALNNNKTVIRLRVTAGLKRAVPEIAQQVKIDSLRYKG